MRFVRIERALALPISGCSAKSHASPLGERRKRMRKFCTASLYKQVVTSAFARRVNKALCFGTARACGKRARIELQFWRFEKRYRTNFLRERISAENEC
jgi:hypothetical protein